MTVLGMESLLIHKKFNEATAILAGDGLLNQAYIVISEDLIKSESEELKIN